MKSAVKSTVLAAALAFAAPIGVARAADLLGGAVSRNASEPTGAPRIAHAHYTNGHYYRGHGYYHHGHWYRHRIWSHGRYVYSR